MSIDESHLQIDFLELQANILSQAIMTLIEQGKITREDLVGAVGAQTKESLVALKKAIRFE